jgi:hypothetical protein
MAKATYDPKADYVVVKGPVSLKGEKGNRTILETGSVTKLSHLQPHEIAFLVEKKGVYAVAPAGGKS